MEDKTSDDEMQSTQALTRALDQHLDGHGDGREFAAGQSLGPYRLQRILGRGGMGSVWLAEQTAPVTRQVALKLIQSQLHSSAAVARFEIERQVLAQMAHPAIAHVYDAGTTERGFPWLTMEYVPGEPINRYCARHRLSTRERLRLFMRVCQGVQHAHQKGVLHRDLKPANILVTELDGHPVPKIIDFGIAVTRQAVDHDQSAPVAGTPEYMSPEQADPDGDPVDTRSDIYALGVVLFELLTGERPLDLTGTPLAEVRELLRQRQPFVPSARLSISQADLDGAAVSQRARPQALINSLRRDLDWIVRRATDPDRDGRYASAQALAADIGRFLDNLPVEAAPGGRRYRAAKFVRRNRTGVAGAVTAMLALTVGLVLSFAAMVQADRARAVAEAHRAELGQVVAFQQRMISELHPEAMGIEMIDVLVDRLATAGIARDQAVSMLALTGGTEVARQVLIGQMLEPAARALEETTDAGEAEPALRATLAEAFDMAGAYSRARDQLEAAVDHRSNHLGPHHPLTLDVKHELADALHSLGEMEVAEQVLDEVIEHRLAHFGPADEETLLAQLSLGYLNLRDGQADLAAERLQQVVAGLSAIDPAHPRLPRVRSHLANALRHGGDTEGALEQGRLAVEAVMQLPSEQLQAEHIDVIRLHASAISDAGDIEAGTQQLRSTLTLARQRLGDRHPLTANVKNELALSLEALDRHDEALELMLQARDIYRMVFGERHRDWLVAQNNLALIHSSRGETDQAIELTRAMVEAARHMMGESHHDLVTIEHNFGARLLRADMVDEAVEQLEHTLAMAEEIHGTEHPMVALIAARLTYALYMAGQTGRALDLSKTAMPDLREAYGQRHRAYVYLAVQWALLLAEDRPDLAREMLTDLEWVLEADEKELESTGVQRWADLVIELAEKV